MNNKNHAFNEIKLQTKILVVSICLVVLTVIGSSYAAFVWSDSGSSQNISSGNYVIEIENTTGNSISLSGAYPMSDTEGKTTTPYKFTIYNKSNTDVEFKLKLENDTSKTNTMNESDIKVYMTGSSTIEPVVLSVLTDNVLDAGYLSANSSKTYELRVWIDENASNDAIEKEYNGKLTLDTKQIQVVANEYQKGDVNMNGIIDPADYSLISFQISGKISLNSTQKKLADTDNSGGIGSQDLNGVTRLMNQNLLTYKLNINNNKGWTPDFTNESADKGLYIQVKDKTKTENGFPVYYYRGAVENNYVSFGTYKTDIENEVYINDTTINSSTVAHANDPILWRIVSINSDGSIKLVSEYNAGYSIVFNSLRTSKYINDDGSNSEIKTELDNWYNTHISVDKNIDSKIVKTNYCSDISGIDFSSTKLLSNAKIRLESKNPTFICPEEAIIDNNKVGALTADELMYAGFLPNEVVENSLSYLDNNTIFWTITPHSNSSIFLYSHQNKFFGSFWSDWDFAAARPVITLKPNVEVSGGTGTKTDPYIIQ